MGWGGLVERLQHEAPHYAQMLPELPRLVHRALNRNPMTDAATLALLVEQRRTNRLLQALLYALIGFVAGALATAMAIRGLGG